VRRELGKKSTLARELVNEKDQQVICPCAVTTGPSPIGSDRIGLGWSSPTGFGRIGFDWPSLGAGGTQVETSFSACVPSSSLAGH
jgi:hypothetical protein